MSTLGTYSWSRTLYLSSDIGNTNNAVSISGIAYINNYNYNHVRKNIKCYVASTSDNNLVGPNYEDPISKGGILAYSGDLYVGPQWNKILFQQAVTIPAGKNAVVYWVDTSSANSCSQNGTSTLHWANNSVSYVACVLEGREWSGCNSSTSNQTVQTLPTTRLYFGMPLMDSNSVALYTIDNPTSAGTMANQIQPVKVTFQNKGFANLTSAVFGWSLNGVLQDTIHWTGNLPDDFYDTLTLGYYTQRSGTFDTIVAWVNMPNNIIDTNTFDDTLKVISYGCESQLSGAYTIGEDEDFETITDFVNIAKLCNPVGDVSLEIKSGIYAENWDLSSIGNIMGNYMLTITSEAHNADSVIIKPASGVALKLGNNKNLTIKDITFDCSSITAYTVQFTAGCEDVLIRDCKILSSTT
ncbi:MAG: hypothetical protein J5701_05810, partial [Bacteroidales bacterium]|nr:hypothetical protein [Bacteroidales bacterium]